MQYSSTNKYRVGITSDVLMPNRQPLFGDKVVEVMEGRKPLYEVTST